jgi:hypothetical protein
MEICTDIYPSYPPEATSTKHTHYADGLDETIQPAFQITHHRYQVFLLKPHKPATSHLCDAMQAGEK